MRERFPVSQLAPQMRDFAERLITYETNENKSSETKTPVACLISAKLRAPLATLMGSAGFHALLSRSLALANAEAPWLRAVQVKADGSLEGFDELETQVDPDEIVVGCVVLLAHLVGLLVAFIGAKLTLQLMREIWPKLPATALVL